MISTEGENSRTRRGGSVIFADQAASVLLADRLEELSNPVRAGWEKIKQNPSRTVYRGWVQGRQVFLKHYHSKTIAHRLGRALGLSDARCEMRFSQYLTKRGVQTPLALAAMCADGVEWLAMAAVAPAERADHWYTGQLANGDEGRRLIQQATVNLARTIGQMHDLGVMHCDLHAENILIRTDTTGPACVPMDLHRMKKRPWLSRRARAMNLAQLLHDRFEWTTRTERLRFLKHYLQSTSTGGTLRGWQIMVEHFAWRHRRGLHRQRDRRVLADNRYFARVRLPGPWKGHVVLASKRKTAYSKAAEAVFTADDWQRAVSRPERLLTERVTEVVKDSPSALIVRRSLTVGGHSLDVFVKRRRRKRAWKVLADCFRPGRAIRAFRLGHQLLTRGIATPLPLAALERRVGPFLLDTILITEAHDAPHLHQFLNDWLSDSGRSGSPLGPREQHSLAREVLRQMGQMLRRLHDSNYHHRDLKSSNMLVQWSPGARPELLLVDLDGVRRVRMLTARMRFQGLMRLNVSLLRCPVVNHPGQLRMLLGYLRRVGGGRVWFKPYWRMLEAWSAKKLRRQIHSRRRKQKAARR